MSEQEGRCPGVRKSGRPPVGNAVSLRHDPIQIDHKTTFLYGISPNGADQNSPGQRPGTTTTRAIALKGRLNQARFDRPFRAEPYLLIHSQGVALGCVRAPRWGWRPKMPIKCTTCAGSMAGMWCIRSKGNGVAPVGRLRAPEVLCIWRYFCSHATAEHTSFGSRLCFPFLRFLP